MVKILIEIDCNGEYCGNCGEKCLQISNCPKDNAFKCHYYCRRFPGETKDDKRLPECIAAESIFESILMIDGMPYGSKTTG